MTWGINACRAVRRVKRCSDFQGRGLGKSSRFLSASHLGWVCRLFVIIYDYMHKFDAFVPRMAARPRLGEVHNVEDIVSGIENTPDAFIGMMRGDNLGKRLVKIAIE